MSRKWVDFVLHEIDERNISLTGAVYMCLNAMSEEDIETMCHRNGLVEVDDDFAMGTSRSHDEDD